MFVRFLGVGPGHLPLLEVIGNKFKDTWEAFSNKAQSWRDVVDVEADEDLEVHSGHEDYNDDGEEASDSEDSDNLDQQVHAELGEQGSDSDLEHDNYHARL
jgi:hypothetical protein